MVLKQALEYIIYHKEHINYTIEFTFYTGLQFNSVSYVLKGRLNELSLKNDQSIPCRFKSNDSPLSSGFIQLKYENDLLRLALEKR